jgi:hypothetical protein
VVLLNMVESTRCHFISQKAEKRVVLHIRSTTKQKEKGKKRKKNRLIILGWRTFVAS